jgi:hypothetical protein
MTGCVYIASMESVVGRLKIGWTTRGPNERIPEWGGDTGAPGVPILEYAAYVNANQSLETRIHNSLKTYRVRGEWFEIDLATAVKTVRDIGGSAIFEEFDRKNAIVKAKRIKAREEAEVKHIQQVKERKIKAEEERTQRANRVREKAERLYESHHKESVSLFEDPIFDTFALIMVGGFLAWINPLLVVLIPIWYFFERKDVTKRNAKALERCIEEVKQNEVKTQALGKTKVSCPTCKKKNYVPTGKTGVATCGVCGKRFNVAVRPNLEIT